MTTGTRPRGAEGLTANYAVASPHRLSTAAAEQVFRDGGNAIDAALAAAVSLTVTLPDNCSIGGDLFALVREPSGRIAAVNASGPAARAVNAEDLRRRHGYTMPLFAPETVTIPGLLAGWEAVWSLGASRPWASAFDAAIGQAVDGIGVSRSTQDALDRAPDRLASDPGMRALFFPDGAPLRADDPLVQSKLAGTLEAIAAHGPASFYTGPVGKAWLETMHEFGSRITADDLATYMPEATPALSSERNGLEVATSPPNSQGLLLLMSLGLVDKRESVLDPLSEQAAVLAEIFRAATEVRSAHLADPRFAEVPVHEIVTGLQVTASGRGSPRAGHGDTVALVTADGEGRAVSLIQSLFDSFGVGVLDQRTGILTHNRGTFFSLDPRSPNILEPGKRPAHTLTPVIVSEGGQLRYVLGTMGGLAQTQILTQVMLHLQRGRSPEEAVALPRWTVGGIEASSSQVPIQAEGRVPTSAIEALATAGWPIVRLEDFDFQAGEAQVIEHLPDGRLTAASDPRSDGTAFAEGPS